MSRERNRPTDVILDLLRGVTAKGRPSSYLVESGKLFGFSENTLRVTLSRLLNRGLLECPRRGWYRLARQTDQLEGFVERWRLGESRVRPWQQDCWLFAQMQVSQVTSNWALNALGFREVRSNLFARPDNLALNLDELRVLGTGIGLGEDVLLIAGRAQGAGQPEKWLQAWHPVSLVHHYIDITHRLRDSAARLDQLSLAEAQVESFRLGGEAINLLAKDPLLPEQLIDVDSRKVFFETLIAYDKQGRRIWASAGLHHATMPVTQLARA